MTIVSIGTRTNWHNLTLYMGEFHRTIASNANYLSIEKLSRKQKTYRDKFPVILGWCSRHDRMIHYAITNPTGMRIVGVTI